MGTGVLDSVSGNQVYFPETKGPTTSDDVERAMNDLNAGTQTAQAQKPNWVQSNIIDPIVKTAKQYNVDPVMGVKAFGAGFFKAEGLGQLIGAPAKYPAQDPNNATPFAPTIQDQPRMPTPTVPEQEMYRAKAPLAYLAGQVGGVGTDFAIANLATDGLAGIAGPVLAKVPAIQKFLQGINTMKEAGTLSEQGVALGEAAAKTPLTWGSVGATGSIASQQQSEGKIDWGQAFKDFAVSTGMGVATEGVFSFMSKPLSEIGSTPELLANTGKKMLASGAVAGAIVASSGGSPKETAFAGGLGALLGGVTLHGDIEGVKESIMAEHLNLKARYIVSQTGEDPSSAYQKAMEQTMNDSEEAINEANAKVMESKPVPTEQRQGASKVFSDPYDPKLFDHLSQFFSPERLVRMDGETRLWLGNQSLKDLNGWAENEREIAFDEAVGKPQQTAVEKAQDEADIQRMEAEGNFDDAKRARGIAVDRSVLDEVASSKELMTNVITKTLNQVTEGGEKTTTRGEVNTEKSGTETGSGSKEEGANGEARAGVRVRNDDEKGIVEGEGKVAKSSEDISKQLAKRGLANLSDEDKAYYQSSSHKADYERLQELYRTDPQQAEKIATGEQESDLSPSDKQLLFNMVKIKAIDDSNSELGIKLARSPLNTERSQAAKTLGASGFENGDFGKEIDPIKTVKDLEKSMEEKSSKTIAKKISKEIGDGIEKVKKESVPKQSEFDKFMAQLRC